MKLVITPANPAPEGAVCVPVVTADGKYLRAMMAKRADSRGTVVLLGGRGDFFERYFETARELMERGYSIAALDVRGQGGSERLLRNRYRGHIRHFRDHEDDLDSFMSQVVLPNLPPPYFIIGHSTGGAIVLHYLRRRDWFARGLVVAPLIGLVYGLWPLPLVRALVFLATRLGLGWMFLPGQRRFPMGRDDFPGNPLTSDAKRWQRDSEILETEPELGVGGPTFSWLRAAMRATAALKAMGSRDRLRCPVLIVASGRDRVVDNEAIRRFTRKVPGVSLVVIEEALHEIMTEKDEVRRQFLVAFDAFVGEESGV